MSTSHRPYRQHQLQAVRWRNGAVVLLDQTQLPWRITWLKLKTAKAVAAAIGRLAVRGAPAIGVAAAYGLATEALRLPAGRLRVGLQAAAELLVAARPTAVNLRWAVERVMLTVTGNHDGESLRRSVVRAAARIEREEIRRSMAIARCGSQLIGCNQTILTICNTGALAGPGFGTALGAIIKAQHDGRNPHVYVCETRPLLQGARLTVFELQRTRISYELIVDSAAATVIDQCDLVITGGDRIAMNGDTANKVGTRMLAFVARAARKPFYVAAPLSSFDFTCRSGREITIEERSADEVRLLAGRRVTLAEASVFNPAFDITPGRLITGFVTDVGLVQPPYRMSLRRLARLSATSPDGMRARA